MDAERMKQLRAEIRDGRRQQGLPDQIEADEAVDEVTAVLLSTEQERALGIVRSRDD